MIARFGKFLTAQGAISVQQLSEVLSRQDVYGGCLGTNLIESGFLVLDDLAELLAQYHGCELPPMEWLEHPDPRAAQVVPTSLVRRYKVLPLKLERSLLHVAVADPSDDSLLDFLATAASRQIKPYVLPEVRLLYWLEVHMGIERHPRFINLAARVRQPDSGDELSQISGARSLDGDHLARKSSPQAEAEPEDATAQAERAPVEGQPAITPPSEWEGDLTEWPGDPALDPALITAQSFAPEVDGPAMPRADAASVPTGSAAPLPQGGAAPLPQGGAAPLPQGGAAQDAALEAGGETLDLIQQVSPPLASLPAAQGETAAPPSDGTGRIVSLEAQLEGATDRDTIASLGIQLTTCYARAAALFLVQGESVNGIGASTPDFDTAVRSTWLSRSTPSLLVQPLLTNMPYRDAPPPDGLDGRLLATLGRRDVHEFIVIPVSIRGRVINLLYADNGGDPLGETPSAALEAIARCMSKAYQRAILAAKSG